MLQSLRRPTAAVGASRAPCSCCRVCAHRATAGPAGMPPACRVPAAVGLSAARHLTTTSQSGTAAGRKSGSSSSSSSTSGWGGLRRRPLAVAAAAADGASAAGARRTLFGTSAAAGPAAAAAAAAAAAGGANTAAPDVAPLLGAARDLWPQLRDQPDWMAEAALLLLLSPGEGKVGAVPCSMPVDSLARCLRNINAGASAGTTMVGLLTTAAPQVFVRDEAGKAVTLQLPKKSAGKAKALAERYATADRARWLLRCSEGAGRKVTWRQLRDAARSELGGMKEDTVDTMLACVLAMYLWTRPERTCEAAVLLQGLKGMGLYWWYGLPRTAPTWAALKEWLQQQDYARRAFAMVLEGTSLRVKLHSVVMNAPPTASAAAGNHSGSSGGSSIDDIDAGGSSTSSTTPAAPPLPAPPPPTPAPPSAQLLFLQQWQRVPHRLWHGISTDDHYRNYMETAIEPLARAISRLETAEMANLAAPLRPYAGDPFERSLLELLPERWARLGSLARLGA